MTSGSKPVVLKVVVRRIAGGAMEGQIVGIGRTGVGGGRPEVAGAALKVEAYGAEAAGIGGFKPRVKLV